MRSVLRPLVVILVVAAGILVWLRSSAGDANSAAVPAAAPPATSDPLPAAPVQLGGEARRTEVPAVPEQVAAPTTATVRVRVVAADSNEPLAARRIVARIDPPPIDWHARDSAGPRAAPGEMATSDAGGRVELEVAAATKHRVFEFDAPDGPAIVVEPLAPGATIDVVLQLPVLAEAIFFGRVVDAGAGGPITGASYHIEQGQLFAAPVGEKRAVDADGVFGLRYRPQADRFVRVEAGGYSWAVAPLDKAHGTRDLALEIPLGRSATLEVLVLDGVRAVATARVNASTDGYRMSVAHDLASFYFGRDPQWGAVSGDDGVARIGDIAPNVPLRLVVRAGERTMTLAEPITLAPGESRRIEVRFGSGATIRGRVESSRGEPIADVAIWRVVARMQHRSLLEPYYAPAAATTSDAAGRFAFDDVTAGSWWIGVAPRNPRARGSAQRPARQLAPLAEVITVAASDTVLDVVVRTDEGLFLSGRALDSSGAPVACLVRVFADEGGIHAFATSGSDGGFRVGPLPAATYRLQAAEPPQGGQDRAMDCASEEVVAAAGTSDIELRLRPGTRIGVAMVGPDGAAIDGEVKLDSRTPGFGFTMSASRDGRCTFDGLAPGTYRVSGATAGGLFATRAGIVVRAGEPAPEIALRLEAGAILELRYDGPKAAESYGVYLDGDCIDSDGVEKGASKRFIAPAGEVEVRGFARAGDPPEVHRVKLRVGEKRELVVGR